MNNFKRFLFASYVIVTAPIWLPCLFIIASNKSSAPDPEDYG